MSPHLNGYEIIFTHIYTNFIKNQRGKPMIKYSMHVLTFTMLMSLMACSEAEKTSPSPTQTTSATPTRNTELIKSVSLNLSSTPLNKQEFLGLIIPEVKQAAPCPFLSDESAIKILKRKRDLKRRETSNESCYWSKNLGFSIKLTVEPLASAKPVRERAYNLESPPVLKSQPKPGKNAVVLYDTVWDKEQAYAFSFEQDDKLIMIYVTGMATDAQRLTIAANEVAAKLSNPTPIDPQDDAVEFNMCSVWNKTEIEAIIGTPLQLTGSNDSCKWESATGETLKQISVGIYYGKNYPFESVINDGAQEIAEIGERSVMIKQRKKGTRPGSVLLNALYSERLVGVTVTNTIENHKAIAVALSKNIDKRINLTGN